jgi:UTP--glucose-1-phosphate uridylyltransferase
MAAAPITAVIPAAGLGTRFLPLTRAVPKELLPLGDRPVIHWLAAEAVAAGAQQVVIVISAAKQAIRRYFEADTAFSAQLADRPPTPGLADLQSLTAAAQFIFIEQPRPAGLGDAVRCAADAVDNDRVLILLGDAPIAATPSACEQIAECANAHGASVVGVREVALAQVASYGIVDGEATADPGLLRVRRVVEKPAPAAAPSRLAFSGRYLFPPTLFELLARTAPGVGGEIQLTDAIDALAREQTLLALHHSGSRYDIGSPAGYFAAQQAWHAE